MRGDFKSMPYPHTRMLAPVFRQKDRYQVFSFKSTLFLLIIIMPTNRQNMHFNNLFVNIINNTMLATNAARISYTVTAL